MPDKTFKVEIQGLYKSERIKKFGSVSNAMMKRQNE